jgi:hypothetical protein
VLCFASVNTQSKYTYNGAKNVFNALFCRHGFGLAHLNLKIFTALKQELSRSERLCDLCFEGCSLFDWKREVPSLDKLAC